MEKKEGNSIKQYYKLMILTAILLVALGLGKTVSAYTDKTAPKITSISFSPSQITPSESIEIVVEVVEEDTGIEGIGFSFTGKSGELLFNNYSLTEEQRYTGKIVLKLDLLYPEDVYSGDYALTHIMVSDYAGNFLSYWLANEEGTFLKSDSGEVCQINGKHELTITGGKEDEYEKTETTYLKSIEILENNVSADGYLYIEAIVENEVNILNNMLYLDFEMEGDDNGYFDLADIYCEITEIDGNRILAQGPMSPQYKNETGNIVIDYPERLSGKYDLEYISYNCDNGTNVRYERNENGEMVERDGKSNHTLTVIGDSSIEYQSKYDLTEDIVAPELKAVRLLSSTDIVMPASVILEVDVWDDQKVEFTSISGSDVSLTNTELIKEQQTVDGILYTYKAVMSISSKSKIEEVPYPVISICDKYNFSVYSYDTEKKVYYRSQRNIPGLLEDDWGWCYGEYILPLDLPIITVSEEFDYAMDVILNNPNLATKLKTMDSGKTARVRLRPNKDGQYIAKKELFKAIQGRDVNILFDLDSDLNYQWIINGKDVETPKDIELTVNFQLLDGMNYGSEDEILELSFSDNGVLPGKMNFRFKSAYVKNALHLEKDIYIYYKNENTEKLELEKNANAQYLLDDSDAWLYFDLTHNSTFMAANSKLKKKTGKVGDLIKSGDGRVIYKVTKKNEVICHAVANKEIKVVVLPNTFSYNGKEYKVTGIADSAFEGCKKLRGVRIGSHVTSIGKRAFYGCTALTKIIIPGKVKKIGKEAFRNCSALSEIQIKTRLLKTKNIGAKAFDGLPAKVKVTVPANKKKTYKKILIKRGISKKARFIY